MSNLLDERFAACREAGRAALVVYLPVGFPDVETSRAAMVAAVEAGDLVRARAVNAALLPVYTGVFRTQGVILVKAALHALGLPSGPVRPPLVDATAEQVAQLRRDLTAGGVTW